MSREDFAVCTPAEFQAIYDAWFKREEIQMKQRWEVGRFVAAICVQPYSAKPILPQSIYRFPWEEVNGDGAAVPKGTSSKERAMELLERVKKCESKAMNSCVVTSGQD